VAKPKVNLTSTPELSQNKSLAQMPPQARAFIPDLKGKTEAYFFQVKVNRSASRSLNLFKNAYKTVL